MSVALNISALAARAYGVQGDGRTQIRGVAGNVAQARPPVHRASDSAVRVELSANARRMIGGEQNETVHKQQPAQPTRAPAMPGEPSGAGHAAPGEAVARGGGAGRREAPFAGQGTTRRASHTPGARIDIRV